MKFLHLGDLHIGKTLGEYSLIEDQKFLLDQILELIRKESVQAVLLAGDLYDRAIPSEAAVKLFDYFIRRLAELGVYTFMISGNHDSDERLNFGSSLFEMSKIYIAAKYEGELYHQTVEDEHGELNVYLMPFVKASQVRHCFPEEKIESYDDAIRVVLEHANIDTAKRNLLVAHQFVAGRGTDPTLSGSEGSAVQSVGLVEKVGFDRFDDFDYVALGHIHSPQQVGRECIRYSGSLMKYSLNEVYGEKSVPLVTVGEKGEVDVKLILLKPMRDLRHLKGELKNLLNPEYVSDPDDFIYATLTDEEIINDAMGIFQQIYPNTVKIDYDNSHTRELTQGELAQADVKKSFVELVGDFYRLMYGTDISEEELRVMHEVAREAGIEHETDKIED